MGHFWKRSFTDHSVDLFTLQVSKDSIHNHGIYYNSDYNQSQRKAVNHSRPRLCCDWYPFKEKIIVTELCKNQNIYKLIINSFSSCWFCTGRKSSGSDGALPWRSHTSRAAWPGNKPQTCTPRRPRSQPRGGWLSLGKK